MKKKKQHNSTGGILFDIKVFDFPSGGIIDKMKIDNTKSDDWQQFLKKFGIDVIDKDKDKDNGKHKKQSSKRII